MWDACRFRSWCEPALAASRLASALASTVEETAASCCCSACMWPCTYTSKPHLNFQDKLIKPFKSIWSHSEKGTFLQV